jgi:hypothetical protein
VTWPAAAAAQGQEPGSAGSEARGGGRVAIAAAKPRYSITGMINRFGANGESKMIEWLLILDVVGKDVVRRIPTVQACVAQLDKIEKGRCVNSENPEWDFVWSRVAPATCGMPSIEGFDREQERSMSFAASSFLSRSIVNDRRFNDQAENAVFDPVLRASREWRPS